MLALVIAFAGITAIEDLVVTGRPDSPERGLCPVSISGLTALPFRRWRLRRPAGCHLNRLRPPSARQSAESVADVCEVPLVVEEGFWETDFGAREGYRSRRCGNETVAIGAGCLAGRSRGRAARRQGHVVGGFAGAGRSAVFPCFVFAVAGADRQSRDADQDADRGCPARPAGRAVTHSPGRGGAVRDRLVRRRARGAALLQRHCAPALPAVACPDCYRPNSS
jgi:hypothetical protein